MIRFFIALVIGIVMMATMPVLSPFNVLVILFFLVLDINAMDRKGDK